MDAGVAAIDIETKKMKEEMKLKEAQTRAVAEHGELALITVDGPQTASQERIALRPPMLQVKEFLILIDEYHIELPLAWKTTHSFPLACLELYSSFSYQLFLLILNIDFIQLLVLQVSSLLNCTSMLLLL